MANGFDLDKLFEGSLRRLQTEAEYFSRLTAHNPELGRLNEAHLVKLLREYLPPKIGLGTGFIVCGGDNPRQSPQCDIIFYDALNNAPLYRSDAWSIYPIEMVYGVLEVKTTLNHATLSEAFEKCAKIRSMARTNDNSPNKAYIVQQPSEPKTPAKYVQVRDGLPPRFFAFGYSGWKQISGLQQSFEKLSVSQAGAHIHGVCHLSGAESHYIAHKAFAKEDRILSIDKNGFHRFLVGLPATLNSMLPLHRRGCGFEQLDLSYYDLAHPPVQI